MNCVLELKDVTVFYGRLLVLDRINLQVKRGDFLALLGPNGAGKTTLIKVVLGLLTPSRGCVSVFGKPLPLSKEAQKKIGYVPQISSVDLRFPIQVFDVVLMGRYAHVGLLKRPRTVDKEKTWEVLEQVGLVEKAKEPLSRLSGGQRQRVFVARALVSEPELLLLDEPTTGVDIGVRDGLFELLNQLQDQGMTLLVVSHDIGVVSQHVNQVACLNQRLVAHGRPDEVLEQEVLGCMYGTQAAFVGHGKKPHIVVEEHPH